MKIILIVVFLLFASLAQAQGIPTCAAALAATPQGPFPCSVTAAYVDNSLNEDGFILERRLNGGAWAALTKTAPNITNIIDATLQQSQVVDNVYEYQIKSFNSAGQAPPSNIAGFTVPKSVTSPKPASSLTITFQGATGQIKLTGKNTINLKNQDGTMTLIGGINVVDLQ